MIFPRKSGYNGELGLYLSSIMGGFTTVKMITEGGEKVTDVARSLGIHPPVVLPPNQVYNWKKRYCDIGKKAFLGKGNLMELSRLRKELQEVTVECDILKEVVGMFSKPINGGSSL